MLKNDNEHNLGNDIVKSIRYTSKCPTERESIKKTK